MAKQLIKGNEAIVKAAVLAGCRAYYGYPITPATEIAEAAAHHLPLAGGTFRQAESGVAPQCYKNEPRESTTLGRKQENVS